MDRWLGRYQLARAIVMAETKEKERASIQNCIEESDFSNEKIARILNVEIDLVEEIQKSIEK